MRETGKVKWFDKKKGYGFIENDGGGRDVFLHITTLQTAGLSSINDGQRVSYEVIINRGKNSAANVSILA
jgi:cold shock protein